MFSQLRPALVLVILFTLLTGLAYPLAITGIALALPGPANGSLVSRDGVVVGSSLIGQPFSDARYVHPRPSAAGGGYDGSASSGTNLAPTSATLAERLLTDSAALADVPRPLPADAITTSGSGLDPHVSPEWALAQVPRIAAARGVEEGVVRSIVAAHIEGRLFGLIGEPRVNVLMVNLALDEDAPGA